MVENSVIISIDEYNRLKEIEKKYKDSPCGELERKIGKLEHRNFFLSFDNKWFEVENHMFKRGNERAAINKLCELIDKHTNFIGYVNAGELKTILRTISIDFVGDINTPMVSDNYKELSDAHIALNKTDNVSDVDVLELHNKLIDVVVKHLQSLSKIDGAYTLNFSVDDLETLRAEGKNNASSDTSLTILDKDNNDIIVSM